MQRAAVELLERRTLLSVNYDGAFTVGNRDEDSIRAVDVDEAGNIYYMGTFNGPVHLNPRAGTDAVGVGHGTRGVVGTYLAKRDSNGNFLWGRQLFPDDQRRTWGWSLAHDEAGNIYAAGVMNTHLFLSKISAGGEELWHRISNKRDSYTMRYAAAVGASGDVFVTGAFKEPLDLDGDGHIDLAANGPSELNAFVARFSDDGELRWARSIGEATNRAFVSPRQIAVDDDENVLTTGIYDRKVDFDPGPGKSLVSEDLGTYVLKLDESGEFNWVRTVQSQDSTTIGVDAKGNVYTAGVFAGTVDFDPGPGKRMLTSPPESEEEGFASDVYISKLDAAGKLLWARRPAQSDDIFAGDPNLAVSGSENVYVAFGFNGRLNLDESPGASLGIREGQYDMLLLKLDRDGNTVEAGQMGGAGENDSLGPTDMAVNRRGKIVLGGDFLGTVDLDPGAGVDERTSTSGSGDSFIMRLSDDDSTNGAHRRRPGTKRIATRIKQLKTQIKAAKARGLDLDELRAKLRQAKAALKARAGHG